MTRFTDFQQSLEIAPNILARRLENFVREGLMTTSRAGSEHLEYHLTPKGLDFKPVIVALTAWGDKWAAPDGPPIAYEHAECGGRIEPHLHCRSCRRTVKSESVLARKTKALAIYQKKLRK